MRVVVNAVPVAGTSLGVVTENLLKGWDQLGAGDEVHVVLRGDVDLDLPAWMQVHPSGGSRFAVMERDVPALCRRVQADVMLGVTPATTMAPLPCPRAVIALDVRHEMRPRQFSHTTRLQRGVSYRVGYRQADAIVCISHRTRADLLRMHPFLSAKQISVAQLGSDHVLGWARPNERSAAGDYALAFGQWGNKNVDLVLDAWAQLRREGADVPALHVVGLPAAARAGVETVAAARGLGDVVTVLGWLDADSFQRQFTGAALVVFPSDYEGFGLPALEAMRLGIPVVVTPDPALYEVTGGLATVMDGVDAPALARALPVARSSSVAALARGEAHAAAFTWRGTAAAARAALSAVTSRG